MSNTYKAIFTTTASGSTSFVDISSIPSTYTDLVLVAQYMCTANGGVYLQYNGDTATNYSIQNMIGVTGATASYSDANEPYIWADTYYMGTGTVSTDRPIVKANIMNYANTSMFKTTLLRSDDVRTSGSPNDGTVYSGVATWRSTSAITSIKVLAGNGNFVAGSTFSLYGIKAETIPTPTKATGGEIFADANYVYHAFGSSGSFIPTQSIAADILVIAGGGGGAAYAGGGGGAGGVIAFGSQSLTATTYSVTVGGGGIGAAPAGGVSVGASGSNSQFASLTASVGGGRGGATGNGAGSSGGSGGGGGGFGTSPTGGAPTAGQGFAGGTSPSSGNPAGSGGGGAGGVGGNGIAPGASGGNGGIGGAGTNSVTNWGSLSALFTATGTGVGGYIAGGGGGANGNVPYALGGSGGGGNIGMAGSIPPTNGAANTGSGGGAMYYDTVFYGGSGGSGLVVVRYAI